MACCVQEELDDDRESVSTIPRLRTVWFSENILGKSKVAQSAEILIFSAVLERLPSPHNFFGQDFEIWRSFTKAGRGPGGHIASGTIYGLQICDPSSFSKHQSLIQHEVALKVTKTSASCSRGSEVVCPFCDPFALLKHRHPRA